MYGDGFTISSVALGVWRGSDGSNAMTSISDPPIVLQVNMVINNEKLSSFGCPKDRKETSYTVLLN
jgi:hypothetical protein